MKNIIISTLLTILILACSTSRHRKYIMPYLDSRLESTNFVDSLVNSGIDTVLQYHKKHGHSREYFIFWVDKSELQLRKINSTGFYEIADWNRNGFYRDKKIFNFYFNHQETIETDKLEKRHIKVVDSVELVRLLPSHYPYVDININVNQTNKEFHLPYGIKSPLDNSIFHFARLIEGTLYNLVRSSYWKQAEKKQKYYPKNYDPTKEKWQNWELDKIRNGEIWDDYYH